MCPEIRFLFNLKWKGERNNNDPINAKYRFLIVTDKRNDTHYSMLWYTKLDMTFSVQRTAKTRESHQHNFIDLS